jgi:hypothetical protein
LGGIYNQEVLNNLRFFSNIYFHGHTVGGTNPSLLEAMASSALICAHDNIFNKAILGDDALYFQSKENVKEILNNSQKDQFTSILLNNTSKIREIFNWDKIINDYQDHFIHIMNDLVE